MSRRRAAYIAVFAILILLCSCPRRGDYIGTFDMSHYCLEKWDGEHICGNSEYGAGGDRLIPEHSLAVPASVLEKYPLGTKVLAVYPNGGSDTLVIQDTGSALEELGRIDLAVRTHKKALELGVIEGVKLYTLK